MENCDCLVLGLGAMGSATLYHLARQGHNAMGIDQFEPGHVWGSSHGHSRAFRVFYRDPLYTELAQAALPHWQELQATSRVPLIHLCGFLAFATPDNRMMEDHLTAIRQSEAPFELLTPAEVTSRFPALQIPAGSRVCFTPQAGFLDADRCVATHLSEAKRLGARIHGQVAVEHIELGRGHTIVRTSAGDFRANRLVMTAGPWTRQCLPELTLPLTVTRQQKFYFQPSSPAALEPTSLPVYADYDTRYYGFPLHGPGVKVADDTRGAETDPDRIDRRIDHQEGERLGNWLASLLPQQTFKLLSGSTCMYTETPDQDFLIGRHPRQPGIIVGAGFSGHGFKFSTLIGLMLAQLATTGSTPYPVQRFQLDRFSRP